MHRHHHHPYQRQEPSTERGERLAVTINVLGDFSVSVGGVPTPARGWSRRTAANLVKVLALAPGRRLHREQVMDLLWPDEAPARTAPRLHKAAHFARRAAGSDEAVVLRDDVVWLFPDAEVTVDAVRFEQLARTAVEQDDPVIAREALAWYGGELLPGDRYEDWATDRRELLHLRRLDVLRVAGHWRELAEVDPTDEEANGELVRRHLTAGAPSAAYLQLERFERVREQELGAPHGSRVHALLAELAQLASRECEVLAELAAAGVGSFDCMPSGLCGAV